MIRQGKTYLITGGSGFLGEKLIEKLYSLNVKIHVIARNTEKLLNLQIKYPDIKIFPGSITDDISLRESLIGVDGVFHLASFKHARLAETFPLECINSNILGTINLLNLTKDRSFDFILGISTDKAAQPNGIYSSSKYMMEKLFEQYQNFNNKTIYKIARFGNILYSSGSVLCFWKGQIEKNLPVKISNREVTRFYWSADKAVDFIFSCIQDTSNKVLFTPTMKSASLGMLLEAMIQKYSKQPIKVIEVGLGCRENIFEKISDNGPTSHEAEKYTFDELLKLV